MQGKKFISPGAWFSMNYPSDWNEFEDGEGSFLFYNPDVWTGNFRISAFKGNASYGKDAIRQELKENDSASLALPPLGTVKEHSKAILPVPVIHR